jgi:hypothetical protein
MSYPLKLYELCYVHSPVVPGLTIPQVVQLAFIEVAVAIALLVVVALGEAIVFLVLLVGPTVPSCHAAPWQ